MTRDEALALAEIVLDHADGASDLPTAEELATFLMSGQFDVEKELTLCLAQMHEKMPFTIGTARPH